MILTLIFVTIAKTKITFLYKPAHTIFTQITEGVISSKTESVLTIETFNKQSHCSKLSIFLLLRNERNKDRNKQNLNQDLKEQFLCFPARKLAPAGQSKVVHLFSVKDEERSERKTRPKQNCKSRVFGPWRGPFRVERVCVPPPRCTLQSLSTPPLPGAGVAVARLVPLQNAPRPRRKKAACFPCFL
jgi:hypothetical protein